MGESVNKRINDVRNSMSDLTSLWREEFVTKINRFAMTPPHGVLSMKHVRLTFQFLFNSFQTLLLVAQKALVQRLLRGCLAVISVGLPRGRFALLCEVRRRVCACERDKSER